MMITPSHEQDRAIMSVKYWYKNSNVPFFYLAGYAGSGKAQPLDCKIQTPNGPINMGDVKVGDKIFGNDGLPTIVDGVFPQGTKPTYEVTFRDGHKTRCCDEHLWNVQTPKDKQRGMSRTVTLREIMDSGLRYPSGPYKYYIPLSNAVQYSTSDLPIAPYSFGILLGDGYLSGSSICVTIADHETDILGRMQSEIPNIDITNFNTGGGCKQYRLTRKNGSYANPVKQSLREMNLLVGGKDKFIPIEYLHGDDEQRMDLLRGLMDSDGSISKNRTSYSTGSSRLAKDITILVQSLGGTAITHRYERDGRNTEYHINIKMMTDNPFWLSRKSEKWSPSNKNPPSRAIIHVEYVGECEQQCISVAAENSLYLTDNFIVTHNTTIAKLAVDACGLDPDDIDEVLYAAYTGKAAMVLRRKDMFASTIHELIYRLVNFEGKARKPIFELDPRSMLRGCKMLVLDECSMVSEEVARDLISFGVKILVLGDPGQLPPPKGVGYFTERKPDFFLEEIHRQALDSPIIHWAHEVRKLNEVPYGDHGGVRKLRLDDYSEEEFLNADQILTGTHARRHDLNEFMLQAEGFNVDLPLEPGIKVLCMRNYRMDGLCNGMIGRTMDFVDPIEIDKENRNFLQRVHIEDGMADNYIETSPMRMNWGEFEDTWELRDEEVKDFDSGITAPPNWKSEGPEGKHEMQHVWAFGYAITVHKSQGSQWDNLCVCDNSHLHWNRKERARWLYTAMTRAVDQCDLVML